MTAAAPVVTADERLVLVAEDHQPIALLLRRLAERCGARTHVVPDGRQALAAMRQERPHLLLLDLIMPLMSGLEVLRAMGEDPDLCSVPVLVVTAAEFPDGLLEVPHVRKPFDTGNMERLIMQTLWGPQPATSPPVPSA